MNEQDKAKLEAFGIKVEEEKVPSTPPQEVETQASPEVSAQANVEGQEAAQETAPPARELPEKLRGKSAEDIADMYLNLEKQLGKTGSEVGVWKEKYDEMMTRMSQLEARQVQPKTPQETQDPVELFHKEAAENPSQAIVNLVNRLNGKVAEKVDNIYGDLRVEAAREFVQSSLQNNPDFKENFETMVDLEKQYGGIIRPEFAGTKIAYQLLHDLARGRNVSRYEQRATEKARAQVSQIRSEKKNAFSESASGSQGASKGSKNPDDMSLAELEAILPRASIYRD